MQGFHRGCAPQVEGMERALDEDTQAALDGIVGQYRFSDQDLRTFEELVGLFFGAGLLHGEGCECSCAVWR